MNRYYTRCFGGRCSLDSEQEAKAEIGVFELDESYFEVRRVRGKRGLRGGGKNAHFLSLEAR